MTMKIIVIINLLCIISQCEHVIHDIHIPLRQYDYLSNSNALPSIFILSNRKCSSIEFSKGMVYVTKSSLIVSFYLRAQPDRDFMYYV